MRKANDYRTCYRDPGIMIPMRIHRPARRRRTKRLTQNPMTTDDMARMVKCRLRDTGLSQRLSPHSFRVTTITDLLEQGVPLADVQYLAHV